MSAEDNNIYILKEEEEIQEESSVNTSKEIIEESDQEEIESGKQYSPFLLLLTVMFNPVEGWKQVRRKKINIERLQSGCFYPLLALVAVSKFVDFFYSVNVGLIQLTTRAVVAFVSYFFAFFCIQMVLSWILPKEMSEKFEGNYGKSYILIALSTLALFNVLTDLLPMLWPILIFLPLWTLYIMFKGVRFFMFRINQEMKFYVLAGAAVIGMPLLIDWILNILLPY